MSQPHAQFAGSSAADVPGEFHELVVPPPRARDRPVPPAAPARPSSPRAASEPFDWRAQAPRLTAAVLAALGVAEAVRITWTLVDMPAVPAAPAGPAASKPAPSHVHWWRLSGAHLFGEPPAPTAQQAALEHARQIEWVLTGVIAQKDPASGLAIVGQRGRIEVLRAGDTFNALPGSRLAEIYNDHVVIDLGGQPLNVVLPENRRPGAAPVAFTAPAAEEPAPGPETAPPPRQGRVGPPLVGSLNAEPVEGGGGMTLHPNVWLQRQYGLKEGDVLTAVNGVPLSDVASLNNALRGAGETVAVTFTHNGAEQTITMPVN
jgi:hypothetical protein